MEEKLNLTTLELQVGTKHEQTII